MTEFKHGELVCNAGELFYVQINSEGEQTFLPLRKGQHAHYRARRTFHVLQAAQEGLVSISKFPDGTLFTMKKGYLVKHGSCMLGVWPRTSEESEPEKFGTEALNTKAILDVLYPPMPVEGAGKSITERLVYLPASRCWGLLDTEGVQVQELVPNGEVAPIRHQLYKTYRQVLESPPDVAYRVLRRLPVGTKLQSRVGTRCTHKDEGFFFGGRRMAPAINGGWKKYLQEVVELPPEFKLPSYEPVSPEDLLWSKTLKGWAMRPYPGDYAVSLVADKGVLIDNGRSVPFAEIAKREKAKKDTKKLNKLPVGTLICDEVWDTWECLEDGFAYKEGLKLVDTVCPTFEQSIIEIPRLRTEWS